MGKQVLCQADDYGITEAVSAGIRKAVRDGVVRNTGLFVNMPASARAAIDLDVDVCLGQDFNLVTGRPLCDPSEVPDLVDENGDFRRSADVVAANIPVAHAGAALEFEVDPYPIDQVLRELEAQYERFVSLVGRQPEYLHPHSLVTPNTDEAIREMSARHGVPYSMERLAATGAHFLTNTWNPRPFPLEQQLTTDAESNVLGVLDEVEEHDLTALIGHPGFVDEDLFQVTSYTMIRIKDLAMFCSPRVRAWFDDHEIQLVTWRDLV